MKFRIILACLLLCSILFQGGCAMKISARELSRGYAENIATAKNSDEFYFAVNAFSFSLFSEAVRTGEGNLVISPLSAMVCLAMLTNGTAGETRSELEGALGLTLGDLNAEMLSYMSSLDGEGKSVLKVANSLWLRENAVTVKEQFLRENGRYYRSEIYSAPFDQSTVDDVNLWVKKKTDGMIPRLLNAVSPAEVMLAINAVFFSGVWETPYTASNVQDGAFTALSGETLPVTLLSSTENVYFSADGSTGFLREYDGGHYAFVGILPDEGMDFSDFLSRFDATAWEAMWESRQNLAVSVKIPEFSYGSDMDLIPLLQAMGVNAMFSSNADFSDLSDTAALSCDVLRQKAEIAVSRDGTRAAAATVAGIRMTSMDRPDAEKTVVLDRPFLYLIVDTESGVPLFLGTVTRP